MQLHYVKQLLQADVLCGEELMHMGIFHGCACDLMSHVLSYVTQEHTLLLTGLTSPQVAYIADAVNLRAVCFVRGERPGDDTIELARERKMVLLVTELPTFEACGKLYNAGLKGCSEDDCEA